MAKRTVFGRRKIDFEGRSFTIELRENGIFVRRKHCRSEWRLPLERLINHANFNPNSYLTMQHNPNSSQGQWLRVNKSNRCPLCQKDHWCLINPIANLALCMRVESQRPKLLKSGETGWLHQLGQSTARYDPTPRTREETPSINCRRLVEKWTRETQMAQLQSLADHLEVTILSLRLLSACYAREHHAWAFVMKDGYDNMVGIRLRNWNGDKWAVTGFHQGCFIPRSQPFATVLVAEGPTGRRCGIGPGLLLCGAAFVLGGHERPAHKFQTQGCGKGCHRFG